jgi:hypothetical protein
VRRFSREKTGGPNGKPIPREMRLYQQARRARIKARRDYEAPGGRGATSARAPARVMVEGRWSPAASPSRAVTIYQPPMQGDIHNPLLVGQVGPGSMITQGGQAADRSGFSSVATATAAIRAELGQENADLRRGMAVLHQRVENLERKDAAREAKAVAATLISEPVWQKVLMAAAMGVQTYAAMCQAAEQDSAAQRARRRETAEYGQP